MKYSGIGGQAVLEGIMMRGRDSYSIAVRKEDGTIRSKTEKTVRFSDQPPPQYPAALPHPSSPL